LSRFRSAGDLCFGEVNIPIGNPMTPLAERDKVCIAHVHFVVTVSGRSVRFIDPYVMHRENYLAPCNGVTLTVDRSTLFALALRTFKPYALAYAIPILRVSLAIHRH
jgi:hypothetical protein